MMHMGVFKFTENYFYEGRLYLKPTKCAEDCDLLFILH